VDVFPAKPALACLCGHAGCPSPVGCQWAGVELTDVADDGAEGCVARRFGSQPQSAVRRVPAAPIHWEWSRSATNSQESNVPWATDRCEGASGALAYPWFPRNSFVKFTHVLQPKGSISSAALYLVTKPTPRVEAMIEHASIGRFGIPEVIFNSMIYRKL